MPYGLLPHELIEIIDSERVISGITKISRMAEDYPYIDHHSFNKEKENKDIIHNRAMIFSDN